MSTEKKTALITGASSGIGKSDCSTFSRNGLPACFMWEERGTLE